MCVHKYTFCLETRDRHCECFSQLFSIVFVKTLPCNSRVWLAWVAGGPQGLPASAPLILEVQACTLMLSFFTWILALKLRSLGLHDKLFIA